MAKAKQKQSVEELLEQALVPEDEQPYEVPANWVWTNMETVAKWGSGGTPSRGKPEYYIGNIPWVKTGELDSGFIYDTEEKISEDALRNSSAKLFPAKSIVIAMYGATIGKVGILGVEATTNQACACGISSLALYYKYLFYYALSEKDNFIKKGKGGAQPNISQEIIKAHLLPLPPLAEQQRIVDRIESLFAKLDQAKELAQNALDSFESRKAAILHKAFTGVLTAKWREEHGVGMDSWTENILEKCTVLMQNGISKRQGATGKETIVLRLADIAENTITTSNLRSILLDENEIAKYLLLQNDVLIVRVNGSVLNVGKFILIENDNQWTFCDHLIKARFNTDLVVPQFMIYLSMTEYYKRYVQANMVSSAGQNTISQKSLGVMLISTPTILEQQEIIRILNDLLKKDHEARELCNVIDKIDLMKKSILARAFRGELATNVPDEESASELLKEVLKHQ